MTQIGYLHIPTQIDVRCPRCGQRALFDRELFEFYREREGPPPAGNHPVHRFGGFYVVERYPRLVPWTPPRPQPRQERLPLIGVVKCIHCGLVAAHELSWPADAYFRWEIRGTTLWAWSAEHARVLRTFIAGTERDPRRFPYHAGSLWRLPKEIIAAKSREIVVRHITRSLKQDGRDLPPAPLAEVPARRP